MTKRFFVVFMLSAVMLINCGGAGAEGGGGRTTYRKTLGKFVMGGSNSKALVEAKKLFSQTGLTIEREEDEANGQTIVTRWTSVAQLDDENALGFKEVNIRYILKTQVADTQNAQRGSRRYRTELEAYMTVKVADSPNLVTLPFTPMRIKYLDKFAAEMKSTIEFSQ